MELLKEYKTMTPQEQLAWLTDFKAFTEEKLPLLCAVGNAWEANSIKTLEEGLKLLTAFGYCRDFVEKSLLFRDFARRMDRMIFYIEKIKGEVARGQAMRGSDGQTLAFVPQVQSEQKRRGRPTRLEAEIKRREQQAALIEQGLRAQAVAKTEAKGENSPENATPQGAQQPTAPASPLAAAVALSQGEGRLHLDQLAWLMSDTLRQDIGRVAGLRTTAAHESNQAKELAERGVPADIIEPHSRAAVEATTAYKDIYNRVDKELADLYSLLAIGGEHIPSWEKRCADKGISLDQLKGILKPYWEKMGQPVVELESITPALATLDTLPTEEELQARAARLHTIRTYFIRKDSRTTAKRIAKMEELIIEARSLGVPTDEYEAILAKCRTELESAYTPAPSTDEQESGKEEKSNSVNTEVRKNASTPSLFD